MISKANTKRVVGGTILNNRKYLVLLQKETINSGIMAVFVLSIFRNLIKDFVISYYPDICSRTRFDK